MINRDKTTQDYRGQEFVITHELAAPRHLVFSAWTDAELLAQWWGPRGFTNPVCQWKARPGQTLHVVMRAPNGAEYPMGGEFREVVAPERLVFTSGALDETGKMLFEFLHTVTLAEKNGRTLLTLVSRVLNTTAEAHRYIGGFEAGMTQSLERLAEALTPKSGPLVLERTLNAPAAAVWNAITRKEAMQQWSFPVEEFKPEAGFEFRFTVEHEGFTYRHLCQIVEVIPGQKLAHTWRYEGYEGDSRVTFELFAEGNKTRLRLTHEGLESFPITPAFAKTNFMQGWTQLIGSSLKEFVEGDAAGREIVITRLVRAPRELVWQAITDPRHVTHWYGPRGFSTTIEEMDVRPGGVWKHVMRGPDGVEYPNQSVVTEVTKPERLVFSHGGGRKGAPGVDFVATWTLDRVDADQTRVTIRMVFPTAAARDTVVKEYGAIEGGKQTLERLAEHLSIQ